MVKICEYEDVRCPFCGNKEVQDVKVTVKFPAVHQIFCPKCCGTFWIPCED